MNCHTVPALVASKLESSPIRGREDTSGVIGNQDLSHTLNVHSWEAEIWVLELAGIAHVEELGRDAKFLVNGVMVLGEALGPIGNA